MKKAVASENAAPMLVIGNDQMTERMVVYDLSAFEEGDVLEDVEVWSVPSGHAAGVKYRENTVFGDVLLVGGDKGYLYSVADRRLLWSTPLTGNNTHSVEILPGGNIIFVNSDGNDVRLFRTSALLQGDTATAGTYTSYPFFDTHGVLWDPAYECLWILGCDELVAYRAIGEGVDQRLEEIPGRRYVLGEFGIRFGHDLSADLLSVRYLWITSSTGAHRFDKERCLFEQNVSGEEWIPRTSLKSCSMHEDGTIFFTYPSRGVGRSWFGHRMSSWLTDTIHAVRRKEDGSYVLQQYSSETGAFYKCRAFCGKYQ